MNDYLGLEWHAKMIAVARERWPEMPESPNIVGASPGVLALEVLIAPGSIKAVFLSDDDLLWVRNADGQLVPREEVPSFGRERIELEQVGMYQLGYGPITQTLYVGADR